MGFKQIGIVVTFTLCCTLVFPEAAATIDVSQKHLEAGKKIRVSNMGTVDPVPFSEVFLSGVGSIIVGEE
jgi:hypothetical protein